MKKYIIRHVWEYNDEIIVMEGDLAISMDRCRSGIGGDGVSRSYLVVDATKSSLT